MQKFIWLILTIPILFFIDTLWGGSSVFTFNDLFGVFNEKPTIESALILKSRLPKAIMAILCGGGLALAGLLMQTFFRNPLAGPSVLGITSGSSLGIAIAVMGGSVLGIESFWFGQMSFILFAVIGALAVLSLILLVSQKIRSIGTLLIFGLMLGYLTSSVVTLFSFFSSEKELKSFAHWGFGNFGQVSKFSERYDLILIVGVVVVIGAAVTMLKSNHLNGWLLGESYAKSMGIATKRVSRMLLLVSGILTATITALCGPIAFLGLAVPHLAKGILKTNNHRLLIPFTVLLGANLALLCDIVAAMPGLNLELPLNAITALVGAPVVISVVLKNRYAG